MTGPCNRGLVCLGSRERRLLGRAVVGGAALISFARVDKAVVELTSDAIPGQEAIGNLASEFYRYRGNAWKHIASSEATQTKTEQEMDDLKASIDNNMVFPAIRRASHAVPGSASTAWLTG